MNPIGQIQANVVFNVYDTTRCPICGVYFADDKHICKLKLLSHEKPTENSN
jgi:hypothetical protein